MEECLSWESGSHPKSKEIPTCYGTRRLIVVLPAHEIYSVFGPPTRNLKFTLFSTRSFPFIIEQYSAHVTNMTVHFSDMFNIFKVLNH
jgi:hypothetical protein